MGALIRDDAFAGKSVLVTGATAGIGRSTAGHFAAAGANVMLSGRNAVRGAEAMAEIEGAGGAAAFVAGDVTDSSFCDRLVDETVRHFGRLDILFNNAGLALVGKIDEFSDEDWRRIIDVNLNAVFYMARAAVRRMKGQGGGVIVNMGSISSLKGSEESAAYSATKGAVLQLTRVMALDHAKDNIRVNLICPGDIDTEMQDAFYAPLGLAPDELRHEISAITPVGRIGRVDEIAQAVMYMASDAAAFMTGAAVCVDGGMIAK
jgi:NAD(P)-dependent dehydrogenase (short-subunit alcohol dehydrogenase family)